MVARHLTIAFRIEKDYTIKAAKKRMMVLGGCESILGVQWDDIYWVLF